MKRIALVLAFPFFLAFFSGWNVVYADTVPKIGCVDINIVFEAYDKAKGISKLVKEEKQKNMKEYAGRDEEIKKQNRELVEKTSVLSEEEKEKRRKDIQQKIKELIKFERDCMQREQKPIRKALTEIYKVVQTIGKREKFDLIIGKRDVIFAKESIDMTDKVIKEILKK